MDNIIKVKDILPGDHISWTHDETEKYDRPKLHGIVQEIEETEYDNTYPYIICIMKVYDSSGYRNDLSNRSKRYFPHSRNGYYFDAKDYLHDFDYNITLIKRECP